MNDAFKFIMSIVALLLLVIGLAVTLVYTLGQAGCRNYAHVTGRQTQWRAIGGCYAIADDGKYYPTSAIKYEVQP